MTSAQYQQFLASLKTDLARWQAQLAQVDTHSLGLNQMGGVAIEDTLSEAKRDVRVCQEVESRLEDRRTLADNLMLYSCLESVGGFVTRTAMNLNFFGRDSPRAGKSVVWSSQLLVTQKEAYEDRDKLLGHILVLAGMADDSCTQLRPYLR